MAERRPIIGVMGGGAAAAADVERAFTLGALIAQQGWILLNGGRNAGIMAASAEGARSGGGLTVGILPDEDTARTSEFIDIPILTGMGSARNAINVLSARVVVACPGGTGTVSEIALALKCRRPVILFGFDVGQLFSDAEKSAMMFRENEPKAVIERIKSLLAQGR